MCGISGIKNFEHDPNISRDIKILTTALTHRGPDGEGIWINDNDDLALGHRRLSIIDLSEKGKQPMNYDNGQTWITYNGEIYNYLEIKNELIALGYAFYSDSDTEVILAAYRCWGQAMLNKFNGMWAFAIYDDLKKELFISRDRFGVKPLYYYYDDKRFIFASEVQAIHKIIGPNWPLNPEVIRDIARGGFKNQGSNSTYLKNVYSLPGGSNLVLSNNKIQVSRWYHLKKIDVPKSFLEQSKKLKDLLVNSCQIRLRSDVPVGTCLSGGLDSGSISAVIGNTINKDDQKNFTHRAFCASFPDTPLDEKLPAQLLANKLSLKLDIIPVSTPNENELIQAMNQCDGPMHSLAFFPIWKLYKHIKDSGITVTLDGQGPDEMLGGYSPLTESLIAAIQLAKPLWFKDLYETYSSQGENKQMSAEENSRNKLKNIIPSFVYYYSNKLKKKIRNKLDDDQITNIKFDNALDESLFTQFFKSPLPGILNQYDRCSMASGVECRMPFLDYKIVEFIFSLPPDSKVGHGYTKRILREAVKGTLPDEIRLNKTKIGFNAPLVDWFKGDMKDFVLKIMAKENFATSPYFDGSKIKADFNNFLADPKPKWQDAWKFWPPVHLIWWLDSIST